MKYRFKYILAILLLLSSNLSAQNAFNLKMGVSYQPMFFVQEQPLEELSLLPSVDIMIQDNSTAFKISLGSVNRVGLHISGNYFVFAFNYGYHINRPEEYKHSMEFEAGSSFNIGPDKDYLFTITSKIGFLPGVESFYFIPVSIGLYKSIL